MSIFSEFRISFNSKGFYESQFVCEKHLYTDFIHNFVHTNLNLSDNRCVFSLFVYNGKEKSEPAVSLIFM